MSTTAPEPQNTSQRFFATGVCICGNAVVRGIPPFAIAKLVFDSKKDRVWEWYCKECGMLYHQKARITNSEYA